MENEAAMRRAVLIALIICCTALQPGIVNADQIKPFESDGCSYFPEGTSENQNLWLECCVQHDYAYWKGGTEEQRLQADEELRDCVVAAGRPDVAEIMLAGVRVGGSPYLDTSYRWGYGWPFGRDYGPLTEEELAQIEEMEARAAIEDIEEQ